MRGSSFFLHFSEKIREERKKGKRIDKRQKERYTEYNSLKYKIFEMEIK